MVPRRLIGRVSVGVAGIAVVAVGAVTWYAAGVAANEARARLRGALHAHAQALRVLVESNQSDAETLQAAAASLASDSSLPLHLSVVDEGGRTLADSSSQREPPAAVLTDAEIREALRRGAGEARRWSHALARQMVYVALRWESPVGRGVVRVGVDAGHYDATVAAARRPVWTAGMVVMFAAAGGGLLLAERWTRPVRLLVRAARSLAEGRLHVRVPVVGAEELATLARALNHMRDHLLGQLRALEHQRKTLANLLEQLREGVVVADAEGRIALINPAACRLLDIAPPGDGGPRACLGLPVEQCIPQRRLQELLAPPPGRDSEALVCAPSSPSRSEAGAWGEVRLHIPARQGDRWVLARVAPVDLPEAPDAEATTRGRLAVLTDITDLTQALQIRTDFVTNASHELRTPVATIRAAVDTLLALDVASRVPEAGRFLDMIARHSRRLEALARDLLELARLESGQRRAQRVRIDLAGLFADVRDHFAPRLEARSLRWRAEVEPAGLAITADEHLARVILDNLVDNAIKFTPPGGAITLVAVPASHWPQRRPLVMIEVADTGCGIPPEDQPRVFERFYQVSRSRSEGPEGGPDRGTGLGLSIVRHAAASLGGSVSLFSRPGTGTRVVVTLPRAEASLP